MEKKLEVKNLQISFRTQGGILKAVRDISFDLYKGETLAIVGESGSGKSVTSKAIIGILAGNSIVEGGEILYDGQDLLKINEDDFHKIRGDKIAMIFQDPLSSLNPIMRVGQQLTEAMILKTKTSRRNARHNFNTKLKLLNVNANEVTTDQDHQNVQKHKEDIKIFDDFCVQGTRLERVYNEAIAELIGLQLTIDNVLFLIEKKQKIDLAKQFKEINRAIKASVHPFVLIVDEEVAQSQQDLDNLRKLRKKIPVADAVTVLKKLSKSVNETALKQKPNYFTLGYYVMKNPSEDVSNFTIDALDKMTKEFLYSNFLVEFKGMAKVAVLNSHRKSLEIKKTILKNAQEYLKIVTSDTLNKKHVYAQGKQLSSLVVSGINRLSTKKNSIEYSFTSALRSALNDYFYGLKNNPVQQKRFDRAQAKYKVLVSAGKTPDWKLKPPVLVDLELAKNNIRHVVEVLINSISKDIARKDEFDQEHEVLELIDFLKDEASKLVAKMTLKMAKAKAIKLLEEVGLPEPAIRYNQYPFEFSGGMRQRVVIAIALSANPDILICDEPTTALDVTIQSQILELINKLKAERNLSVIFITHNLGVVANMADRVAVMYAGKIVEFGQTEEVFYDPRHPYTWALLCSMPDINTKEKLEAISGTPPNMIYPPKGDAFADRNKYALEIDFDLQPPLFEVTGTHYAATWLLHPNAPKVEVPKIIRDRIARINEEIAKNEQR